MAADPLKNESSFPPLDTTTLAHPCKQSSEPKWRVRTGWGLTVLSGLFCIFDGVGKLMLPAAVVEGSSRLGFPISMMPGVGILLLACTLLYLIPRTAVLGAILLTGYLGGAVAVQMRASTTPFENVFPVLFAILVWGGIYLRERSLCSLVPIRRCM